MFNQGGSMFDIGLPELLVIVAIALIVFGPQKLPELAKAFGKAMREFKKATEEIKENFDAETQDLREIGRIKTREDLLADLSEAVSSSMVDTVETPPTKKTPASSENISLEKTQTTLEVKGVTGEEEGASSPRSDKI
jgi:TatA/E family protein of Tat protein translocase